MNNEEDKSLLFFQKLMEKNSTLMEEMMNEHHHYDMKMLFNLIETLREIDPEKHEEFCHVLSELPKAKSIEEVETLMSGE